MRESESEREAPHDSEVLGSVSGVEVVLTVLWLAWGRSGCVACASARGWGVGRGAWGGRHGHTARPSPARGAGGPRPNAHLHHEREHGYSCLGRQSGDVFLDGVLFLGSLKQRELQGR